jgi:hypothetical protein
MILTDNDINSLLVKLGKMHNMEEYTSMLLVSNGWRLTIRYDGVITADLRDIFGTPNNIPQDFMKMIEDGVMHKLDVQ